MHISLATAKTIIRMLRADGIRITRRYGLALSLMGAGGAVTLIPGVRTMAIEKGAPFETVIHELGHLIDFRKGNRWRRLRQRLFGRIYAAEIAANREACDLLQKIGSKSDVSAYRWMMVASQLTCRRKKLGKASEHLDLAAEYSTRHLIIKEGRAKRFMLVISSPRRLHCAGPGEYCDLAWHARISVEWSCDGLRWERGRFIAATKPESRQSDGRWLYRVTSDAAVGTTAAQFARLKVHKI